MIVNSLSLERTFYNPVYDVPFILQPSEVASHSITDETLATYVMLFVCSTWAKYSQPSKTKGTRLLLINEVSLGKCTDLYKFDTDLTAPPDGYNSTHGVRKTEGIQSDFQVKKLNPQNQHV